MQEGICRYIISGIDSGSPGKRQQGTEAGFVLYEKKIRFFMYSPGTWRTYGSEKLAHAVLESEIRTVKDRKKGG